MPARVLVIDDEQDVCRLLTFSLEQAGFEVSSASSASEGLLAIGRQPPVVVVLDVGLPDMSGVEVCRRLRADPGLAEVGIMIGETDFWGRGYAGEAWKAACNWLLDKDYGGIRKLEAGCARSNTAMLKIIQGSGFKQEGELLNHFLHDGAPVSAVLFGRMR